MRRLIGMWLLGALAAGVLVIAVAVLVSGRPDPVADRPANAQALRDTRGQRIIEYRWALGSPEHIVRLRIPAGYVWYGGAGLSAALGSDYPDPNVVGPFMNTIILEALLPNLEPRTPENEALFKTGASLRPLTISLLTNVRAKPPNRGRGIVSTTFARQVHTAENTARREYGMSFGPKPDRFGLKHLGALGDFERFRERWGPDDVYYTDDEPKSTMIDCTSAEIKEEDEDPSWKRRGFCHHLFFSDVLDSSVTLFYSRHYLPEWQALEDRVESLFRTFKIIE